MELLKIMGVADKYAIIGNGVLKSKAVLKEQAEARKESEKAAAGDAGSSDGGNESTRGGSGDNRGDEKDNKPKTPEGEPANQHPEPDEPNTSDDESGAIAADRLLPRRGRAGGSTSDISKAGTPGTSAKSKKK